MHIQHGKAPKTQGGSVKVTFPQPFRNIPTVVISPHWDGQNDSPGGVDCIDVITRSDFTFTSANQAPNFYVEWIAISNIG